MGGPTMDIHCRRSLGFVTAALVSGVAVASSLLSPLPVAATTSPAPFPLPRVGPGPGSAGTSEGTAVPSTGTGAPHRVNGPLGASAPWSIVGSGDTSYSQGTSNEDGDALNDVTCVSSTDCWAVGYYYNGSVDQTLIEQDTGSGWHIVPSPDTSTTLDNELTAIACLNADACWAVGDNVADGVEQPLLEQDTGTGWSIIGSQSPNPEANFYLTSMDCTNNPTSATDALQAPAFCAAVGEMETASAYQNVVLTDWWPRPISPAPASGPGEDWGFSEIPSTSPSLNNDLFSITCFNAGDCQAVGAAENSSGVDQTLTEQYNGSNWSIVASPSTSSSQANALDGVTCVSASDCWAVGTSDTGTGGDAQTLVEQYNGSAWSIVPSPDTSSSQSNTLYGVACPSATDCWAMGRYENGSVWQTLSEQYNGSGWSVVPSPDMSSTRDSELFAVVCLSTADCRAVGTFVNGTAFSALVEQTAVTEEAALASASLGTTVAGTLHPVSWGQGNEEVFWRGTDGNLWQEYTVNGTWYGPQQLTTLGNLASDPEPVSWGTGNLEVFWRGTDGSLWQMYYLNGWQGPQSLGDGPLGTATPEPVSWGPGNLEVFWEGTDQGLWQAYYANGWHGPQGLGDGPLGSATPEPVSWGPGNLEVFWEGTDQNLWQAYYANGWHGPQGLGDGPLGSAATLTPVSWGSGNLEVFWEGTDQGLWHAYYANGWHGPQGLGNGPLGSAPHPVATAPSALDVFWEGTDQGLWHAWFSDGWHGPQNVGAVPLGDSAMEAPPQPLTGSQTSGADVFWEGPDGTLWHASDR
jgi:hypothetical protein